MVEFPYLGKPLGKFTDYFDIEALVWISRYIAPSSTHSGKVMVDGHDFSSIERPGRHKIDPIQPAVIRRICLHATENFMLED